MRASRSYALLHTRVYLPLSPAAGMTLPYRGLHAFLCLFFTRCKYYFAWLVSEGSANLAGFG